MSESKNSILSTPLENLRFNKNLLPHIEAEPKKQAIESHEPLILVNAGQDVGTMGVLLHRVNYMTQSGIDYEKIVVISATNANAENYDATCRFTGSTTVEKFAKQISGKYPIRYKHFIIHGVLDEQANDLALILQHAADNKASVFIIGNARTANIMAELVDEEAFVLYNL